MQKQREKKNKITLLTPINEQCLAMFWEAGPQYA